MFLCHVACYDRFMQMMIYCLMHCVTFGDDANQIWKNWRWSTYCDIFVWLCRAEDWLKRFYEGKFGAKQLSVCDSGICSCREESHMCISKFEATDKSCKHVDFFLSPTNTTQLLHLLESFFADTQILFYTNHKSRNSYTHIFCYYCCSEYGAKHTHTPASKMWSRGRILYIRKSVFEFLHWDLHTCRMFSYIYIFLSWMLFRA